MIRKIIVLFMFFAVMGWTAECDNQLFSLKAMSTDGRGITIQDILIDLSNRCDISILFEDKEAQKAIKKPLNFINIHNYTLHELLDFILAKQNLFYSYDAQKHILSIAYYKTKNFNIDYINLTSMTSESRKSITLGSSGTDIGTTDVTNSTMTEGESGSNSATDYTTITTTSQFTFWESLKKQLHTLLSGISHKKDYEIFINQDASLVTVRGTRKELDAVRRFLDTLTKRMHKQVLIEAKLIEVTYNDDQTTGIDWSKFALQVNGTSDAYRRRQEGIVTHTIAAPNYFIGYNFSMQGLFNFLKKYGTVKVLSSPKILTLNNQPAIINVGSQLSYQYTTSGTTNIQGGSTVGTQTYAIGQTFVGITLYVIPEITDDNHIIMKINPVTSELISDSKTGAVRTLPPDTKIKQLTSIVKVADRQKILIGGLVSQNSIVGENKVPVLGDTPILGKLFHSTKKSLKKNELFILITPKIIHQDNMPTLDEAALLGGHGG